MDKHTSNNAWRQELAFKVLYWKQLKCENITGSNATKSILVDEEKSGKDEILESQKYRR